jgi:ATP-dependent DNA helicase RecG
MSTTGFGTEQLSLLPEQEIIGYLVERSEDQWLERVSSRIAARELGNLQVGFANAEGGLLVIGVHDGRVEGVAGAGARLNEWRQAAMDFTVPPVRHSFGFVDCLNATSAPDQIAVLEIEPSERAHENIRGETYLRVGDENRRLSALEAQELRYAKGESAFDGTALPPPASRRVECRERARGTWTRGDA